MIIGHGMLTLELSSDDWRIPIIFQSISDRLFNTQSRVMQGDWLKLENGKKATLKINMPNITNKPRYDEPVLGYIISQEGQHIIG